MKDVEIHKARLEAFIRYVVDILRIEGIDIKTQELDLKYKWITTGDRCWGNSIEHARVNFIYHACMHKYYNQIWEVDGLDRTIFRFAIW